MARNLPFTIASPGNFWEGQHPFKPCFFVRRGHLATLTNDLYNLNRKRIIVIWEALNPF